MPFMFAPLLIGAGMGALGGLLAGKDPLKGALLGGITGGLLGPASGIIGAGGVGVGGAAATSAATSAGAAGLTSTPFLGSAIASTAAPVVASATNAGFNAAASGLVPDVARQATFEASMGLPSSQLISAGAPIGTAFPLADVAATQPSFYDSLTDTLSPYFDPRDLGNSALQAVANQPRQQMPQAPSGGVSRGQAQQGSDVMALLQTIKQPERRRISLM